MPILAHLRKKSFIGLVQIKIKGSILIKIKFSCGLYCKNILTIVSDNRK
jgi:hypothetical protein